MCNTKAVCVSLIVSKKGPGCSRPNKRKQGKIKTIDDPKCAQKFDFFSGGVVFFLQEIAAFGERWPYLSAPRHRIRNR